MYQSLYPADEQEMISVGDVTIDVRQRIVLIAKTPIQLTRREFDLLVHLARHPGWVFTKDQLLDAVWINPSDANHRAVENLIYWIRRKMKSSENVHIQAVVGYGFKLLIENH